MNNFLKNLAIGGSCVGICWLLKELFKEKTQLEQIFKSEPQNLKEFVQGIRIYININHLQQKNVICLVNSLVHEIIQYTPDNNLFFPDYWQTPEQTFQRKKGIARTVRFYFWKY